MSLITKHSGQRLYLKIIDKNITVVKNPKPLTRP